MFLWLSSATQKKEAEMSFGAVEPIHKSALCHIPEEWYLQIWNPLMSLNGCQLMNNNLEFIYPRCAIENLCEDNE